MGLLPKALALSLLATIPLACGGGGGGGGGGTPPPPPAGTNPTPEQVEQVILDAGRLQPGTAVPLTVEPPVITQDGLYERVSTTHRRVDLLESCTYLGANDDIIWPGAMIKGTNADDFLYVPISHPRAPITLSVNVVGSGFGNISTTVSNPTLSSVAQGVNDLLDGAFAGNPPVAANVFFESSVVHSEEHMNFVLKADISRGNAQLQGSFNWVADAEKTKVVAKYQQTYFKVNIDTPPRPAAFFPADVQLETLRQSLPAGSMPLYVAGVDYGMMAITTVTSSRTEEQVQAALAACYSNPLLGIDADISAGLTARQVLSASTVKTRVYGGSTAGLAEVTNGYEGFLSVVRASSNFVAQGPGATPGVPLVYRFRHLRDSALAQITMASEYTTVQSTKVRTRVRITLDNLFCDNANDDCGFGDQVEIHHAYLQILGADNRPGTVSQPGLFEPIPEATNQFVMNYYQATGDGIVMDDQTIHFMNGLVTNTFDLTLKSANGYLLDNARLRLRAFARDLDGSGCSSDEAASEVILNGNEFFQNGPWFGHTSGPGHHLVRVLNGDFDIYFNYRLEILE